MDRLALVALVFLAGLVIGGLGWERLQLRDANSEWQRAVKRTQDANREALAAERRLADAKTKRDAAAREFAETVDASDLAGCPVDPGIGGMLSAAAAETRAN